MSSRRLGIGITVGALAAVAAALAVPAIRHLREVPPPPPPPLRVSLQAPAGASLGFGDAPLDAALSPDGTGLAFVATSAGTPRLWFRRLTDIDAQPLDGTDGAQLPVFDRTGQTIAFFASGELRTTGLDGRVGRTVAPARAPGGAAWLTDGTLLAALDEAGPIVRLTNGRAEPQTVLHPGDRRHVFPFAYGADGAFLYVAVRENGQRVIRVAAPGEDERELGTTSAHVEAVHDHVVHLIDGALVAEPIARERPRPANPTPRVPRAVIATGVGVSSAGKGLFAASARVLLHAAADPRPYQLTWLTSDGGTPQAVRDPGEYWRVRLAPDDRFAAVTLTEPLLRTLDVVALPTGPAGYVEKVSLALAADTDPVWSPDGARVVFRSLGGARPGLFVRPAHDPEAPPVARPTPDADYTVTDWRGTRLLAHAARTASGTDLWELDERTLAARVLVTSGFNETEGRWSPDGRWVAYVSDESGRPDLYATRLADGARLRLSFAGGTQPRWAPDGRSVYFLRDGRLMRAALTDGTPPSAGAASPVGTLEELRDFDVSRTTGRLLVLAPTARVPRASVSVVLDWATLLQPSAPR